MNESMFTRNEGQNEPQKSDISNDTLIVVSQALSYINSIVYNRITNSIPISKQINNLASSLIARRDEGGKLVSTTFESSTIAPDRILYGIVNDLKCGTTPSEKSESISWERIANLLADNLLSESTMYTIWAYLRLIARNNDPAWQADIAQHLGITPEFNKQLCDILEKHAAHWKCEIANEKDMICSVASLQAFANLTAAHLTKSMRRKKKLTGLSSPAFQHEIDVLLTKKILSKVEFLGSTLGKAIDLRVRMHTVSIKSDGILVTPHSHPSVYETVKKVCTILGMEMPEIYIDATLSRINAYTTGVHKPILALSPMCVSFLDHQELSYVIGHECGHIMCGHVKFHALMDLLASGARMGASYVPIFGPLIEVAHKLTLAPLMAAWNRRGELSADRAGLLACQNPEAAFRATMKLMGQPFTEFHKLRTSTLIDQAISFEDLLNDKIFERLVNGLEMLTASHPRSVFRTLELINWMQSGAYDDIIQATPEYLQKLSEQKVEDEASVHLRKKAIETLAAWACKHFTFAKKIATQHARAMINHQKTPNIAPFNTIAQILITEEYDKDENLVTTSLVIRRVSDEGKIIDETYVMETFPWDAVRSETRNYFLKSGNSKNESIMYQFRNK